MLDYIFLLIDVCDHGEADGTCLHCYFMDFHTKHSTLCQVTMCYMNSMCWVLLDMFLKLVVSLQSN
eukprot:c10584_g1_i1 orf=151-348(+)